MIAIGSRKGSAARGGSRSAAKSTKIAPTLRHEAGSTLRECSLYEEELEEQEVAHEEAEHQCISLTAERS